MSTKLFKLFAATLICFIFITTTVFAVNTTQTIKVSTNNLTVKINGEAVTTDVFVYNGRTYVQLKNVCDMLGQSLTLDTTTNTANVISPVVVESTPIPTITATSTPAATPEPTPTITPIITQFATTEPTPTPQPVTVQQQTTSVTETTLEPTPEPTSVPTLAPTPQPTPDNMAAYNAALANLTATHDEVNRRLWIPVQWAQDIWQQWARAYGNSSYEVAEKKDIYLAAKAQYDTLKSNSDTRYYYDAAALKSQYGIN